MQFQVVSPFDYADWNDRLAKLGSSSFFNTVEWARVLSASYGYKPCYVVGLEGGELVGLLPMMQVDSRLTGRRGVGLPFSDYCEPIEFSSATRKLLGDYLQQLGLEKRWRYYEIRHAAVLGDGSPVYAKYKRHTLDLKPGEQALFDQLGGSVRTSIRKAQKAEVEVTFSGDLEAVRLFYNLNCMTRRRHGLPPQPYIFFKNLQLHVLSKGLGHVVTAWRHGEAIASSVYCHFGGEVLFKYGASDEAFHEFRGPTLVMWEAIRRYVQEGYAKLSLGRTEVTNAGLRRYKLGWGARESELSYLKFDVSRGQYIQHDHRPLDSGYRMVKMLPLSCSRLAGLLLYKHMG